MKAPKTITRRGTQVEFSKLRSRVFSVDKTKKDERFFKNEIHNWLISDPITRRTWNQQVMKMVEMRNNTAQLKYCFFSERHRRIFPSSDFTKWAATIRDTIKKAMTNFYA